MKLTEKQAIAIAQAIYGKQDERVKEIELMYKNTQSTVIDMINTFIARDINWNSKANPDEIATFLSNLKDTFQSVDSESQIMMKTAYKGNPLKTNGDVLDARLTQELVKQAVAQKMHLVVSTKNIPDVVNSKNYKAAIKKSTYHNKSTMSVDSIFQRTVRNAVLDRHVDSSMFSSINKQTIQTSSKVREIAQRAAKSPKDSLNWQKEVANVLTGGNKVTNGQMGRATGMIRTATAQALNRSRLEKFKKDDVKKYKFVSLEAQNICQECNDLDGQVFNVEDAEEGVNFPLIHWNCQCTVIEANDGNDWDTSDHDVSEELAEL